MKTLVGGSVVLVAALFLAGCTGAPTPSPSNTNAGPSIAPTSAPAPSATPGPSALTPPSRVGLECDDVVPTSAIAGAFSAPLTATDPTALDSGPSVSSAYRLRALGGLECAWSDGKPESSKASSGRSLSIRVVPLPVSEWNRYKRINQLDKDVYQGCGGGTTSNCFLQTYVGSYWIDISMWNIATKIVPDDTVPPVAAARAIFSAVITNTKALGTPDPAWLSTPDATVALPHKCASFVSPATIRKATGVAPTVVFGSANGGWSLEASIDAQTDNPTGCFFQVANSDSIFGSMNWLRGGEWAAKEFTAAHTSTTLDIPGLEAGDSVTSYLHPDKGLEVNLVIGGNWISFTIIDRADDSGPKQGVLRSKSAVTIASAIVANLYA